MRWGAIAVCVAMAVGGAAQPKVGVNVDDLREALEAVEAPLIIDLPEQTNHPTVLNGLSISSFSHLKILSWAMDRTLVNQNGCLVMHRQGHQPIPEGLSGQGVYDWLIKAGPDTMAKLMDKPVSLYDLPEDAQREIMLVIRNHPGLLNKAMQGEPLGLRFAPGMDGVVTRQDGKRQTVLVAAGAKPMRFSDFPNVMGTHRTLDKNEPALAALPGDLKFGEGEQLVFAELVERVEKHYKTRIKWDRRLAEWPIFIKGSFDLERLVSAIKTLSQVEEVKAESHAEMTQVADANAKALLSVLDRVESIDADYKALMKQFLTEGSHSFPGSDFAQKVSGYMPRESMGENDRVSLLMYMMMQIYGEGGHPLPDGKGVLANYCGYGVGPIRAAKK